MQTTTFRKDHLLLLRSLENLALTHAKNGKYEKASPILRGILRSKESKFGADHPSSIETMGMLAFVLIKDIDVLEAAVLLEKVSVWQQMHLDPSHPSVKMTKDAMKSVASLIDGKSSLWI